MGSHDDVVEGDVMLTERRLEFRQRLLRYLSSGKAFKNGMIIKTHCSVSFEVDDSAIEPR